jgi:type IV secretion system protein VirB9
MDPRRLVILGAAALALAGCQHLPRLGASPVLAPGPMPAQASAPATVAAGEAAEPPRPEAKAPGAPTPAAARPHGHDPGAAAGATAPRKFATMAPIPNPRGMRRSRAPASGERPRHAAALSPPPSGRAAIAAANLSARETSRARGFLGGVQVFVYDPGRIYEVWTAPLRVTTLTLSRGETVISKAAGDTVRWQIGETLSGEGPEQRAHVMIKPLVRGLETNLVLATNRRIYLLQLRSGEPSAFNTAVTWDLGAVMDAPLTAAPAAPPPRASLVEPQAPLDAGFRIRPKGRRPSWTPSAVATDGMRTFLSFPPGVIAMEAPALFALGLSGEPQLVNYRQQGSLWVVDRVLTAAELRVGGRRPQVVRIERMGAAS